MTKLLDEPDPSPAWPLPIVPGPSAQNASPSRVLPWLAASSPRYPVRPSTHREYYERGNSYIRSRTSLLERSIREEPEEDDYRYVPMHVAPGYGSHTDGFFRRRDPRLSFGVETKRKDYGSFGFMAGGGRKGGSRTEKVDLRVPFGYALARHICMGIVVALLIVLFVLIVVEVTSTVKRNNDILLVEPALETIGAKFSALQQQIIRSKHSADAATQQTAVYDLVKRLLPPEEAGRFAFLVVPAGFEDAALDAADIRSANRTVLITGNSGSACAFALYHFLKYYCGCHVSWSARQLNLPAIFPEVSVTVKKADWLHYYQNVCTSSYSFVWWNWTRWEQEIDWMALQGINFPLAFTGQEEIWRRVYSAVGLNDVDLQDFFVGPAFLAWGRMGNIRKWAGPLPREWMMDQVQLQHKILKRMESLGMIPILPAFNGIVPVALKRVFPQINLTRLSSWAGFQDDLTGSYFLDPEDPLFTELGLMFIREMRNEFQYTSHFYNTDTFNEQHPANESAWDVAFVRKTTQITFGAMVQADRDAIWVMQGWMLYFDKEFWNENRTEALLTAVPLGRLVMLDLYSENFPVYNQTHWFHGQPFIWNMLHNFGGALGLYGRLSAVNTGPLLARTAANSTMVGVGITPEGINQNDIMYEFMNEMSWRENSTDLDIWVRDYVDRRYGKALVDAHRAYQVLQKSVYDCAWSWYSNHGNAVFINRPAFNISEPIWYEPEEVLLALQLLLKLAKRIPTSDALKYDIVDVSRQSLQLVFRHVYEEFQKAVVRKDLHRALSYGKELITILADMEQILSLHPSFSLTQWVEGAKSWARSKEQRKYYQWNALNQITLWGPRGEIVDYGSKQWSGVVSNYYQPRWNLFFSEVMNSLEPGAKPFNQTAFNEDVFERVEVPFTMMNYKPPASSPRNTDNIFTLGKQLHSKYNNFRSLKFCEACKASNYQKIDGFWKMSDRNETRTATKTTKKKRSKQHIGEVSGTRQTTATNTSV